MDIKEYIRYKGIRINYTDRYLTKFILGSLLTLNFCIISFVYVYLIKGGRGISGFTTNINQFILLLLLVMALIVSLVQCVATNYFKPNYIQSIFHRELLAKMIVYNNWYTKEKVTNVFTNKSEDKIVEFPCMYYSLKNGIIKLEVKLSVGSYRDILENLEKELESIFYSDLLEKELIQGYVVYKFIYDTIGSRISINDIKSEIGRIELMKNLYWEYDKLPHALVIGGTGGGKSYFLMSLIKKLLDIGADITILDPKNTDLADLETVIPNVYYKKDDMLNAVNKFCEDMLIRNEKMKELDNYKTGSNYSSLGLKPHFLVFDEYVAFMTMIGRESTKLMEKLSQIVMLGRQSGYFLILACQRPDAQYLGGGIRDQFNFRVALGKNSDLGYNMAFGETNKKFFNKSRIKGRGYVDKGDNVISEFYTPLIPKGYNFLEEIEKSYKAGKEYEYISEV